jgi:hypothetical protein
MPDRKQTDKKAEKKTKKDPKLKVRDLKPSKDAKAGEYPPWKPDFPT